MKVPKTPNKLPKLLPRNPAALPAMMRRAVEIPKNRATKRSNEKEDFTNEIGNQQLHCRNCNEEQGDDFCVGSFHCSDQGIRTCDGWGRFCCECGKTVIDEKY